MVPRETPLAPSRWHPHIVQRRVSRVDHLRPHRLNWEALVVGPLLGGWLADAFGFRVIFGLSGGGRLLGILLYIWLAVWPILEAQRRQPATSPAGAA